MTKQANTDAYTLADVQDAIGELSWYAKAVELAVTSSGFSTDDQLATDAVVELAMTVNDKIRKLQDRLEV